MNSFWGAVGAQLVLLVLFFVGVSAESALLVAFVVLAWTPAAYLVGYRFQRAGGRFRSPVSFSRRTTGTTT